MTSQDDVNDTIQRVGLVAISYYPEVHVDAEDYSIASDISWCMEPLGELDALIADRLRDIVGRAIVDPTQHREEFFAVLSQAFPDDAPAR